MIEIDGKRFRTLEEKIILATKFLQQHGYQVFVPNPSKGSAQVEKMKQRARSDMLKMGGASAATLVSYDDLQVMLKCSENHVRALVRGGVLPRPVVVGNRMHRWRLQDITEAIKRMGLDDEPTP